MTEAEFCFQANKFLNALFDDLVVNGVSLEHHWDIDHICFRSDSDEDYRGLKKSFLKFSDLLIESEVNGRLISTFKLNRSLVFNDWQILLVELPAPKAGKIVERGFEHIEVVADLPFDEIRQRYPGLPFDDKGLMKPFNRELEVSLGKRNIKFHHSSLESVIQIEKNIKVWCALSESKILKEFKDCCPLVVGTFPLGIETSQSDIDILLWSHDLNKVEEGLRRHYSLCESFRIDRRVVDALDTLICNFSFKSVPFEIFVQNLDTVKQTAYKHFFIEERLLKIGGPDFKERIKGERRVGTKTEPAFAKILKFEGDPYSMLLKLQKTSNLELFELVKSSFAL